MRFAYALAIIFSLQAVSAFCEDIRLEAPTEDAQKQSKELIRDVFKSDFAKTNAIDKQALAVKLLQQAIETRDDPASRYVLYREAEELAAQVGDAATVLNALGKRSQQFKFDVFGEVERVLDVTSRASGVKDQFPAICNGYLEATDAALAADKFDSAVRLATKAESAARNAKDLPLLTRSQARIKESRELLAEYQKVRTSVAKLATAPDDSESNLTVGKFHCFIKNDWSVGLPLLAKGSDVILKELAEREFATTSDTEAQLALADDWWSVAEKLNGIAKATVRKHAVSKYEKVVASLSGLSRTRVERRLEEARVEEKKPELNVPHVITGNYKWEQPDAAGSMELLMDGTFTRRDTRYGRSSKGTWKLEGTTLIIIVENWKPEKLDRDGPGKFKGPHHKGGFITMEKTDAPDLNNTRR